MRGERIPFSLSSIRAARDLRSGAQRDVIRLALGISSQRMRKIEIVFGEVPDAVLARIERLFDERERLRQMVSTLLHGNRG